MPIAAITSSQVASANQIINEVPENRRQEIYEYMGLFGYKPDNTIIQVKFSLSYVK
jgi:hypothetical protein